MSTRSLRREFYFARIRELRIKWLLEEITGLFSFIDQFPCCQGKNPHQIVDQYLKYLDMLDKLESEGGRRHVNGGFARRDIAATSVNDSETC